MIEQIHPNIAHRNINKKARKNATEEIMFEKIEVCFLWIKSELFGKEFLMKNNLMFENGGQRKERKIRMNWLWSGKKNFFFVPFSSEEGKP